MSTDLPSGWQMSCLDELASSVGGGTPSKTDPKYWIDGTIPWVSPKDMKTALITDTEDHVTEAALGQLKVVPAGSVLVVVRSGILSHTLPVAQTKIAVTVNQDMRAFVPERGLSTPYLAWQLIAKERDILDKCSKDGTTVASIEGPALARFPLAVAPVAEQGRIVSKLEELLSDLDAGVAELKAAQKKLQQYRQSLLKAAVEGALTTDWREAQRQQGTPTETGAQLLARILTERRARWEARQLAKFKEQGKAPPKDWQKKYPEPLPPDAADLPALPDGWVWASIDQLSPDDLTNGRSVPSAESGAKVLRLTAVRNGVIDLKEVKNGDWTLEEARPFAIAHGDLLIVRGNGSKNLVGRVGLVGSVDEQIAYPDTLIRLRVCETFVSPRWVASVWDSDYVRSHIELRARTSAGIYKISQPDIVTARIPVPPMAEAKEIIARLDSLLESLAGLQSPVEEMLHTSAAAQRQNILNAAFAGQLVRQDTSDESAQSLLERIGAERETVTTSRRRTARECS